VLANNLATGPVPLVVVRLADHRSSAASQALCPNGWCCVPPPHRTADALRASLGSLLDRFTPAECASYFQLA
jgi:hypothetical protein